MLALRFDGDLELADLPRPVPAEGEALIRVRLAGICNTDLEIVRGYFGFRGVLGHEFVGEVAGAPGKPEWVGRRVVGEINLACGECEFCRAGLARHCPNRRVLGILGKEGCFAEFVTLPVENLHPVPSSVPDRAAVFTEPLAATLEILEQVHVEPASLVAVVGDGKLALLIVQILRLTGCRLRILGKYERKLALAAQWGAVPIEHSDEWWGRFDVVVEASGSPDGFETALQLVRPRGTIVLKSTYAAKPVVDTSRIVVDEVQLIGSRCGQFEPALRLLEAGLVETEPLISGEYPLARGLEAFAKAQEPGVLKVLLTNP